jgi:DNA mismatch repair protein MSH5
LKHHPNWDREDALPEDFTFVFTEDEASYYKNVDTRNLDVSIGDIDSYIKDTEALMVSELEEVILDNESELRNTFNALADLDCILAFASCAVDQKYVRPVVAPSEANCIRIRNGRHPLQEIIIDGEFIPNDTNIDDINRLNVITGPNFSGKSCYARQIGILTYMAHLGCFLPCDAAQISVVDQILARFSAVETCAVPQSSFQLDLTKSGGILRRAGPRSLVIVDEFGKGMCRLLCWYQYINCVTHRRLLFQGQVLLLVSPC